MTRGRRVFCMRWTENRRESLGGGESQSAHPGAVRLCVSAGQQEEPAPTGVSEEKTTRKESKGVRKETHLKERRERCADEEIRVATVERLV